MSWQIILFVVMVVGLVMWVLGLRGRRVGSEPVCGKCGFDLRGRPAGSERCSECGADLHRKGAVVVGQKVRRRGVLWSGFGLMMVAGVAFGVVTYVTWDEARFYWMMPTTFLERRLPDLAAQAELRKRITSGRMGDQEVEQLVDRLLAASTRGKGLTPIHEDVLVEAVKRRGMTPAQMEGYVLAHYPVILKVRPTTSKLGDGPLYANIHFGHRADKLVSAGPHPLITARCAAIKSEIGGKPFDFDFSNRMSDVTGWAEGPAVMPDLPPGKYQLKADLRYEIEIHPSVGVAPMKNTRASTVRPLTADVEVLPDGAPTADVVTDDATMQAVRGAFKEVYVARQGNEWVAAMRVENLPIQMAVQVDLREGERERDMSRGGVLMKEGTTGWWVYRGPAGHEMESVDLVLKYDDMTTRDFELSGKFFGKDLVFEGVPVKPLEKSLFFFEDETMRARVEATMKVTAKRLSRTQVKFEVKCAEPPCPLQYGVVVMRKGEELPVMVGRQITWEGKEVWVFSGTVDGNLQAGEQVDVILRPRADDWVQKDHKRTEKFEKAWGGEVVMKGVVVP